MVDPDSAAEDLTWVVVVVEEEEEVLEQELEDLAPLMIFGVVCSHTYCMMLMYSGVWTLQSSLNVLLVRKWI